MKKMNSDTCFGLSLSALAASMSCLIAPTAGAQERSSAQAVPVEEATGEILVTARKRQESLLDVPMAISAMGAEEIEKRGVTSILDVVQNTPGINVTSVQNGRNDRSQQSIALRGMAPTSGTSTLAASFIDGVPVASSSALNSITDPERIEILRGPQVAYFGRNSFAGAINVITKLPAKELGGSISAMGGTRSNYDIIGSIEGPIIRDILGIRITGRTYAKDGSYINSASPGQTVGDQRTDTGTVQLVFTPSSRFTAKAFGMLTENRDGPAAQGMLSNYELRANNGTINIPAISGSDAGTLLVPKLSNCTFNGYALGASSTEARVTNPGLCGALPALNLAYSPAQNTVSDSLLASALGNGANRIMSPENGVQGYGLKSQFYHLHLSLDYEIGDTGLTLSSLTGYNYERYSQLQDVKNYDSRLLVNPLATPANGRRTFYDTPTLIERENKDFSQEVRLSFDDGGALQAMIGSSYLIANVRSDIVTISSEIVSGIPRATSTLRPPQKAKTISGFGSVSYDFTDALTLNMEGRWQQDQIFAFAAGNGTTISPAAGAQYGIPSGVFAPLTSFFSKKFTNFLPRVILNYNFTPEVMGYASWSKAANVAVGSFNTTFLGSSQQRIDAANSIGLGVIVNPEKLTNYEIGLKGRFLDGKLQVTMAAYAAEWKDQHNGRTVYYTDTSTNPATTQFANGLVNAGRTLLKGLELDVTATPVEGFSISAAGQIADSSLRSFSDPSISRLTGVIGDGFVGNQLPLTSKYSGNLGLQYNGAIGNWDNGSWFIRSDVNYKSKQYIDQSNLSWIKDRTQVNVRAGITKDDVTLEIFSTNLFNNKNYVSGTQAALQEPTLGIAGRAYGYISMALPELRVVGLRVKTVF